MIKAAKRTEDIREYYFSSKNKELAQINKARISSGQEPLISLGIGAPDRMPPQESIEELYRVAQLPGSHVYQNYKGSDALREAFADWYLRYYGVRLDPSNQIQPLFGSKEGILLISLAFVDEGAKVLVPSLGYPTYVSSSKLSGAQMVHYQISEESGWLPDFEALEKMDLTGVKVMWVNYPNMPTGANASTELFSQLVSFGLRHNILIVNDNPYSFVLTSKPLSIFSIEGSQKCCLELNSLSKSHNMSGWRVGMVAGAPELISEILKVKSQMDSGMFLPMQMAAVKALGVGEEWYSALNEEYRKRKSIAFQIFDLLGISYNSDSTGLFVWGHIHPESLPSFKSFAIPGAEGPSSSLPGIKTLGEELSDRLLYQTGVFMTPGMVFGEEGAPYIRLSLCANAPALEEALQRIKACIE